MDVPSPEALRILRQARLYGYLQASDGSVFHPGGNRPLCRVKTAESMALAGWLKKDADRYVITPQGVSAEALH
jgi:hypothetical protein